MRAYAHAQVCVCVLQHNVCTHMPLPTGKHALWPSLSKEHGTHASCAHLSLRCHQVLHPRPTWYACLLHACNVVLSSILALTPMLFMECHMLACSHAHAAPALPAGTARAEARGPLRLRSWQLLVSWTLRSARTCWRWCSTHRCVHACCASAVGAVCD